MFCTPTKLLQLLSACKNTHFLCNAVKFCVGGETFSDELYEFIKSKNNNIQIYNVYGPTETTMWTSEKLVTSLNDVTIGKPLANTQIYILDQNQKLLPIGVAGELCIAGDGVGQGYLNRPELTLERFVKNPFSTEQNGHGKVMYRTGDLARWREDGEIEFLGKN